MRRNLAKAPGAIVPQPMNIASELVETRPGNVCVFPRVSEMELIVAFLIEHQHQNIVSIGCGDGWVEGLLQQRGDAFDTMPS